MPEVITDTIESQGRTITTEAVEIKPKHLEKIFERLGVMAESHIEASEGGLVLIESPEHLAFHTMGEPIPTELIEPTASLADKRNPAIQIAVDGALWRAPHVIPSIYDSLREGYGVGINFSHNMIQDVPLGFGALLTQFGNYERYRQSQGDEGMDVVRGMLISQMLKRVGIVIDPKNPTPADHVMTMLAHHVWSSITTGRSAHGLRKDMPGLTRTSNDAMKDSVRTVQDEGRLFLAGSLSGATMKESEDDPNVYVMDGAKDGSMEMAMHKGMRWLSIALLLEPGGQVRAEFSGESEGLRPGELRSFDSPDEINAAMDGLAQTATNISSVPTREYVHVPQKSHRLTHHRQ